MKFKTEIDLDNAAFIDNSNELSNALEEIAIKVGEISYLNTAGGFNGIIKDSNGNTVGVWTIK